MPTIAKSPERHAGRVVGSGPPGSLAPGVPAHPIYLPPYVDNTLPPYVDNTLPPVPPEPPPDGADKPPPETGGWGYVNEWSSWGYFPTGVNPSPKR